MKVALCSIVDRPKVRYARDKTNSLSWLYLSPIFCLNNSDDSSCFTPASLVKFSILSVGDSQEERRKCAWNSHNFFILDQTIIPFSRQSMPILGMFHLKNEWIHALLSWINPQSYRCNIAATLGNMFLETIFCLDGEDERGSPVVIEIPSIYLVSSFTLSANDGLVLE